MNEQILKLTKYRIKKILEIEDENFDFNFVENMIERIEDGKNLSNNQVLAIENIYNGFCND